MPDDPAISHAVEHKKPSPAGPGRLVQERRDAQATRGPHRGGRRPRSSAGAEGCEDEETAGDRQVLHHQAVEHGQQAICAFREIRTLIGPLWKTSAVNTQKRARR